jgi:hypothetical protein
MCKLHHPYTLHDTEGQGGDPGTGFVRETRRTLDALHNDGPKRSASIEPIFDPLPSVDSRRATSSVAFPIAWHAARMTWFVSSACLGMLFRVVHCNVGRPELWALLTAPILVDPPNVETAPVSNGTDFTLESRL